MNCRAACGAASKRSREYFAPQAAGNCTLKQLKWGVGLNQSGVAEGSRTPYLRSHNPVLYLMSYGHHCCDIDMGRLNSRRLVGVERFELPTSCSQSRRATRLRYTPYYPARPRAATPWRLTGRPNPSARMVLITPGPVNANWPACKLARHAAHLTCHAARPTCHAARSRSIQK